MHKDPVFLQVPLGKIEPWKNNPRNIRDSELDQLAKSLEKFGQFQVLTCWPMGDKYSDFPTEDTGRYQTGGGNMRWHAMKHKLRLPDDTPRWISLNFPTSEAERIELSLRDNQRFGQYEEDKLAELVYPHISEIELEDYKLDLGEPVDLKKVIEDFGPNGDGHETDPGDEKTFACPECDFEIPMSQIRGKR